jgi:coronin-7
MGLLPLDKPGKGCSSSARVFHAHSASVSDWDFSEFNDSLLATGAEDSMVKAYMNKKRSAPLFEHVS